MALIATSRQILRPQTSALSSWPSVSCWSNRASLLSFEQVVVEFNYKEQEEREQEAEEEKLAQAQGRGSRWSRKRIQLETPMRLAGG